MTLRVWWGIVAAICAVTAMRIAATHAVFSPTCDEPIHIAAGYEFLTHHKYTLDSEHPPLARIFFALPLVHTHIAAFDAYARGADAHSTRLETEVLGPRESYMPNLVRARRGNLLFVIVAIIGTALWARALFGDAAGLIAALLFALAPPVLAHGGLCTTDMAGAATLAVAMFALDRWLKMPTIGRAALLGAAIGLGCLSKFTFLLFFSICAAVAIIAMRRVRVWQAVLSLIVAFFVVWAGYGFQHSRMVRMDPTAADQMQRAIGVRWPADRINMPAPQFVFGILRVMQHSRTLAPVFLLGRVSYTGFRSYFPVVLAVKTPIPLLILAFAGACVAMPRSKRIGIAIMLVVMFAALVPSHINLGVRHILPAYVLLAMLAAAAATQIWSRPTRTVVARTFVVASIAWMLVDGVVAHPDYLSWMNAFAGPHPEHVVVESNLDWGQDVLRLSEACRARGISSLGTALFAVNVDFEKLGMPAVHAVGAQSPSHGWIAISETILASAQAEDRSAYAWLTNDRPFTRIGTSIRLYRVP